MNRFVQKIAILVMLSFVASGQTSYVVVTNNPGTKMAAVPVTSALWRGILPTETPYDALLLLGLTNQDGFIVSTNLQVGGVEMEFGSGSNSVISVQSATTNTTITSQTNGVGGITITLTNGAVATLTSQDQTVLFRFSTNGDGSIVADASVNIGNVEQFLTTNTLYDNTAINGGYVLTPATAQNPSNIYYIDFGRTNSLGQHFIFADLTATNSIYIAGVTNCAAEHEMSFDVFFPQSQVVYFPTNLFLATNGAELATVNDGLFISNTLFALPMNAGQLLRFTIRSNLNGLEPQWEAKP